MHALPLHVQKCDWESEEAHCVGTNVCAFLLLQLLVLMLLHSLVLRSFRRVASFTDIFPFSRMSHPAFKF